MHVFGKKGVILFDGKEKIGVDEKGDLQILTHSHLDHMNLDFKRPVCGTEETMLLAELYLNRKLKKGKINDERISFFENNHVLGAIGVIFEEYNVFITSDFLHKKTFLFPKRDVRKLANFDLVVVESTYGWKGDVVERMNEVEKLEQIIEENREEKKIFFFANKLGLSQELIRLLNKKGIKPRVQKDIQKINEIYLAFGHDLKKGDDEVYVFPYSFLKESFVFALRKIDENPLIVSVSGRISFLADENVRLSGHLFFNELVEFLEEIHPKKIFTYHGKEKSLAKELTKLGFNASPLNGQRTLSSFFN